jgi:hypothetical protein
MRMQKCQGTFVTGAVRDGMVISGFPVIRRKCASEAHQPCGSASFLVDKL